MDGGGGLTCLLLLVAVLCVCAVSEGPIGTSEINCASGSKKHLGEEDEGYEGDVELVTGIASGTSIKLEPYLFENHLEFLELSFTPGDTTATVRTKKPLDADILKKTDQKLFYSIVCDDTLKLKNERTLKVNDLNDNRPVFTRKIYNTTISETAPVDSEVFRVLAEDGDSSITNSRVTYSIEPTPEDFIFNSGGAFILKRRLNYNVSPKYNFTVTAQDVEGLNDTATVLFDVEDYDNLNPYFSHNVYQAFISENQVGAFRAIEPEAIRAQDGDSGINMAVTYSIDSVSPEKYGECFNIDNSTGVLSVLTAFDREEMSSSDIFVSIKAAQTDDRLKTADTVVLVTVEDVNDNHPAFDQTSYSVTLLENSPDNTVVFKATVTDRDQGGFVGTLRILSESTPFTIDSGGTVRVKNSAALDRETTEAITFQIEAEETEPAHTALAEVRVTLVDENDNSPAFTSNKYDGAVFANQTVGMLLVQVMAEDPDADENGQIRYSIDFGNGDGYFLIGEDNGEITLAKPIPLQENKILEFPLYVTARDRGTKSRSSSVEVNIRAPGNSRPQFLQKVYNGTIEEEQDSGALVLKVNFLALASETPVTLRVETQTDKFAINSNGELSTATRLDYDEAPHDYSVRISISDGVYSDDAVVEVQVTDINDNSPVFSSSSLSVSVPEDAVTGSNVTAVPASDKDSGFNKEIRYSLREGEGRFAVDPVSGMVSLSGQLDRETKAVYDLLVVAEDQGRPAKSATASLLVRVTDVNDNAPNFSEAEYQVEVVETQSVGTSLFTLAAPDPDDGANGRVTYRISQQSPSSDPAVFELDSTTGTLKLVQPLDYSEVKVYRLMVQASDGGTPPLVGNSSVLVKVMDVNNNPPEFDRESYDVSIPENLASGASILTLKVTDRDEGGFNGALRVLPESAPFSVGFDGTITVRNSTALDRETSDTIVFQVEAREATPPNHVATANVSVTLLDENDNSPEFSRSEYVAGVSDSQTEGMLIVKVEAEDSDAGINGQIKYSIDFGNQHGHFSIDENSGAITLAKIIPLEAHQTQEFLLFITASDGGVVSRSASAQVQINAVGDTKPQFKQSIYSGTIEEERDPDTVILKVGYLATGEPPVTLKVETQTDKFAINSNGELSTRTKLDYDEAPHNYSVRISISDGVHSDDAVVEVQVTDINDNSPVFSSSSLSVSVPEDAVKGSNVTAVPASDKDSGFNKEIRYSLREGEGRFAIDPVSGMVSLSGQLDRETKAAYDLLVVAEDQGRPAKSATASLLVRVSDVNDNAPNFSEAEYQVEVVETQSVGTSLFTLAAPDPDDGANGRVTYRISQQSPSSDPAVFELDSTTGTLKLVQPLDYSEVKVYRLMVQASDGGTPPLVGNSSVLVKVMDVNNNPPEFDRESYDVSIPENLASGASILTLKVTDRDEGGFNGALRVLPESAPFSIGSDGTITVRNSTALDRETSDTIVFQVEAREATPPNHVATANVSVTLLDENDNSPEFSRSEYVARVPSSQTEGMLIVKVEAEDSDAGVNGQIKYSIDFGNQHSYFSIDENSGAITLAKIIPLEAHRTQEFLLFITASDGGVVSRSASVQVQINAVGDTKPHFTQSIYSGTIEEERDPGTVILKVGYIATGEPPVTLKVETETDKFAINSNGELSTRTKLDYDEAPHNYSVRISISDGVHSDDAVVEVQVTDINDNSPVFSSSSLSVSVPEDAVTGSNVTAVPATDKDSGFNKEIRYSLRGGEGRFAVDPVSGMVSLSGQLDRETKAAYDLLVVAEDQARPAKSATASLLVRVSDVNDNAPNFSEAEYQVEVVETQSVGTSLFTLAAPDPDDGANGRVTYRISQQSPSSDPAVFELDSTTGTLKLVQPLDYSEVKVYRLMVQASDGGTPPLVGNSSVLVKVMDVNNNPPEFDRESYDVSISENLASGASILTLKVTDRDEGGFSNGHFLYTSDTFDINNQGVVSLKKDVTLDRETKDSYTLQVVAVDQASGGLNATAQLYISILDYNDNAPQFPAVPDPLQFAEGEYTEERPGRIFTIVPTDADLGPSGEVILSISPPHPLFRFTEDGELLAVGSLDRESRDTYELVVTASDKGTPRRESTTTVRVRLTDINDNRPEFSSSSYSSSVLLKEAEAGKLLMTLKATDADEGNNSLISYSFLAGGSPYLTLNSETGAVTLTSDFADVTEDTTLNLTAVAEDNGEPRLTSTAPVIIHLRLVSLVEGVAFGRSFYNFSLAENQHAGATVGSVWASSGSDLYGITYTLKSHGDLFSVSTGGAIQTKAQLDKEQQEWYILDVEAADTRTPPTSAAAVVTVWVQDVNESPQFATKLYNASVFSIAPYKTPVITVTASDPDTGDSGQLSYSLAAKSPHFDVESSSGLVYVTSVEELGGEPVEVEVRATDPGGLQATTKVKVTVQNAVSTDVVVISLNQPANIVEKKVPELERALGAALDWTIHVMEVRSGGAPQSRSQRAAVTTLVSFISLFEDKVIPAEEVIEKLKRQSEVVKAELAKLFGDGLDFDVGANPESTSNSQAVIIAMAVLLALSLVALIAAVVIIVRFRRQKETDSKDSDKGSFDLSRHNESYMNWSRKSSNAFEKKQPQDIKTEDRQTDGDKASIVSSVVSNRAKQPQDTGTEDGQTDSDKASIVSSVSSVSQDGRTDSDDIKVGQSGQMYSDLHVKNTFF